MGQGQPTRQTLTVELRARGKLALLLRYFATRRMDSTTGELP